MEKMFRVYDNFDRRWVNEGVYLSPSDVVLERGGIMKKLFNLVNLRLGSDVRYVVHKAAQMSDRKGVPIFEGDICLAKEGEFIGIVTYVSEHCSFYLLDHKNARFYPLGADYVSMVEVIGNIFDNPDLIEQQIMSVKIEPITYQNADDSEVGEAH